MAWLLINSLNGQSIIFSGNVGDGHSSYSVTSSTSNNIFMGGNAGGAFSVGHESFVQNQIFVGGVGQGTDFRNVFSVMLNGIFDGGKSQGYSAQETTANNLNAEIFSGGSGQGFISQVSSSYLSTINVAGGVGDGVATYPEMEEVLVWTGNESHAWNNPNNWIPRIQPQSYHVVRIPPAALRPIIYNPLDIDGAGYERNNAKSIQLYKNSRLDIREGGVVRNYGSIICNGFINQFSRTGKNKWINFPGSKLYVGASGNVYIFF